MALSNLLNGHQDPSNAIYQQVLDEEITSSRAAELLGLPLYYVRDRLNALIQEQQSNEF